MFFVFGGVAEVVASAESVSSLPRHKDPMRCHTNHTFCRNGKIYPPESWQSTLNLPAPGQLQGLDMQVKSIFLLPFSVMHPKFIIVDRKVAVLPSCNVSWEDWFEGCVTLTGPVVSCFINFWREFWAQQEDRDELVNISREPNHEDTMPKTYPEQPREGLPLHTPLDSKNIPTIFLPSPHHRNPDFRFPWQDHSAPPPTPLNTFFLRSLLSAEREIYIQTPNLTAAPVLTAILSTLRRGIDIHIITSEKLMILEQLVTAGTTTFRCIEKLIARYQCLASATHSDLEAGRPRVGRLRIGYFVPRAGNGDKEPQQSHLKCTIVDQELVILGSGNLDRASWYTSQELGVAFFDGAFAKRLRGDLESVLEGRVKSVL
jgi:phosphatidylserine/phosphatidylglycerophosphate/cardiolipin synthase-like enzyme